MCNRNMHKILSINFLHHILRLFLILSCSSAGCGCAYVGVYNDEKLTQKSAMKYYDGLPCLLVTKVLGNNSSIKVDLVSLPDLEHPHYVHYHPGLGTVKMDLKTSNGVVTSYTQDVDTKVPDTINAVSGLIGNIPKFMTPSAVLPKDLSPRFGDAGNLKDLEKKIDNLNEQIKKLQIKPEVTWALYRVYFSDGEMRLRLVMSR